MSRLAVDPKLRRAASFMLASSVLAANLLLGPLVFLLEPFISAGWVVRVVGTFSIVSMVAIFFLVIWKYPYGSNIEEGGASAIVTLFAAGTTLVGLLLLVSWPKEDGFPFGVGFLLMLSLPTLVFSSLAAWKPGGGATQNELS